MSVGPIGLQAVVADGRKTLEFIHAGRKDREIHWPIDLAENNLSFAVRAGAFLPE